MTEKYPYKIPAIDLFKIIEKDYFYNIKKHFLSHDSEITDDQGHNEFINNPNLKLDYDTITVRLYCFSEDDLNKEYMGDRTYNFYEDYLKPGIKKGVGKYVSNLKGELNLTKNFKNEILKDFFAEKKREINTLLINIQPINIFKNINFKIFLELKLNEILHEINSMEQMHFPVEKIHLNLDKGQILILFYALIKSNIIIGLTPSKLFILVENYFTYREGQANLPVIKAYKSVNDYIQTKPLVKARKNLSKKSFDELDTKFSTLFDFLRK